MLMDELPVAYQSYLLYKIVVNGVESTPRNPAPTVGVEFVSA